MCFVSLCAARLGELDWIGLDWVELNGTRWEEQKHSVFFCRYISFSKSKDKRSRLVFDPTVTMVSHVKLQKGDDFCLNTIQCLFKVECYLYHSYVLCFSVCVRRTYRVLPSESRAVQSLVGAEGGGGGGSCRKCVGRVRCAIL